MSTTNGSGNQRAVPPAAPTRQAPAYRDNQTRGNGNSIPADAARYARDVLKIDPVEYWKGVQEMERNKEFKVGNPWSAAR